jgi:hypothetical protein
MTATLPTTPTLAPATAFPTRCVLGREYRWNTTLNCLEIKRWVEGYWDRSAFNGFLQALLFSGEPLASYALRPEFPEIRELYIAFSDLEDTL